MANKPLTDKKISEIYNHLAKNIDLGAANGFAKAEDKVDWLKRHWSNLEDYDRWVDKYPTMNIIVMPKEEQLEKVFNTYPDLNSLSESRKKYILKNNDFTEDEMKDYYEWRKVQRAMIDKFNEDRYKEISKEFTEANRAKDSSYFNTPLANEYARKHYIKGNPNQAVINEIAGKTAAASDFAPWPFSLGGPLIRTAQKFAADEPVLTPGTAADFGGAIIPDVAEKPARMAFQFLKGSKFGKFLESKLGKQLEARVKRADAAEAKLAAEELERFKGLDLDAMTNEELIKNFNNFQTPEIKAEIANQWKARGKLEEARAFEEIANVANGPDLRLSAEIAENERKAAEQALIESERRAANIAEKKIPELELKSGQMKKDQPLFMNGDLNAYYKNVPIETISEHMAVEPNRGADLLYNVLTLGGRKAARSTLGGRRWDQFNPEPKDNIENNINEVIKMYSNGWSTAVPPEGYESDPLIRAAYEKWKASYPKYEYKAWRN